MTTVELAEQFLEYCQLHPEYRFWQAIRNFTNWPFVLVNHTLDTRKSTDTYYIQNDLYRRRS